jgi:hypothetical protein
VHIWLRDQGIELPAKSRRGEAHGVVWRSAFERQLELALQQARYEVAHARRQYDSVDPANRLVAGELERRWNDTLQAVAKIEGDTAGGQLIVLG